MAQGWAIVTVGRKRTKLQLLDLQPRSAYLALVFSVASHSHGWFSAGKERLYRGV